MINLARILSTWSAAFLCASTTTNVTVDAFLAISRRHHVQQSTFVVGSLSQPSQLQAFPGVENASELWTSYNHALETSPLVTKSLTAAVILGSADLAGQVLEAKQNQNEQLEGDDNGNGNNNNGISSSLLEIDFARFVRFAFFGLVLQAPWNHFYFQVLDGVLPPTVDPLTATTGIKVVIDQFVQAPIFTVLIFAFLGTLEGKNLDQIKKQLDDDYVDTMFANCKC
jgi:peroxisomal membrane protein 2